MSSILDNLLTNNPAVNTIILVVMIIVIGIGFAMMGKNLSFPIVVGYIGLIFIFLYAYEVIPGVFGAVGFIIEAMLIVYVLRGKIKFDEDEK